MIVKLFKMLAVLVVLVVQIAGCMVFAILAGILIDEVFLWLGSDTNEDYVIGLIVGLIVLPVQRWVDRKLWKKAPKVG